MGCRTTGWSGRRRRVGAPPLIRVFDGPGCVEDWMRLRVPLIASACLNLWSCAHLGGHGHPSSANVNVNTCSSSSKILAQGREYSIPRGRTGLDQVLDRVAAACSARGVASVRIWSECKMASDEPESYCWVVMPFVRAGLKVDYLWWPSATSEEGYHVSRPDQECRSVEAQ